MCLTHCEIPMNQPKNHPQTVKDRLGILFRSKPQLCVCTNAYKEETKLDWKSPNEFGGNVPKMFPRERPVRLYTYYYSFTNEAEIVVAMCGNILTYDLFSSFESSINKWSGPFRTSISNNNTLRRRRDKKVYIGFRLGYYILKSQINISILKAIERMHQRQPRWFVLLSPKYEKLH